MSRSVTRGTLSGTPASGLSNQPRSDSGAGERFSRAPASCGSMPRHHQCVWRSRPSGFNPVCEECNRARTCHRAGLMRAGHASSPLARHRHSARLRLRADNQRGTMPADRLRPVACSDARTRQLFSVPPVRPRRGSRTPSQTGVGRQRIPVGKTSCAPGAGRVFPLRRFGPEPPAGVWRGPGAFARMAGLFSHALLQSKPVERVETQPLFHLFCMPNWWVAGSRIRWIGGPVGGF